MRKRHSRLFLLLVAASLCFSCRQATQSSNVKSAETPQTGIPLTLNNIFGGNRSVNAAEISPDGTKIAVGVREPKQSSILLVSASGGPPEPFVDGAAPSWSPDGAKIAFLRSGQLWIAAVESKQATQITKDLVGVRDPVLSPDGTQVAFYSTSGGHQDIWLVSAKEGAAPRQLTREAMPSDDARFAPAWSPDGRQIAYISCKNDFSSDDVWLVDVNSGQSRQLSHRLMATSTPAWSPSGKKLALLATAKNEYWYEDLSCIYLVDPTTGKEDLVKTQVYASDWNNLHNLFWHPDEKQLFFLCLERGDFDAWTVPTAGGVATRVTNMGGAITSFRADSRAQWFAFVRNTPTRGSEVDVAMAEGGVVRRVTRLAPEWSNLQSPQEISFRSYDGLYIQGFLYLPAGFNANAKYPTLVQVHGGGTNSYLRGQNLLEQYLAHKGYVVLAINYRGGSGFGRGFQDLSVSDWANGQARDAGAAADYLRTLPYCNGKVGIYGYSYGGIMTMAAIARVPGKFDAAVPMAGIYDFADAQRNADRVGILFTRTGHGGTPEEKPQAYAVSNTLARMKDITTPVLIMHGEADVRAPFRQFQMAVEVLKQNGKIFESKSYPGEPHGFRNPADRIDLYTRMEAFFDKYVKSARMD